MSLNPNTYVKCPYCAMSYKDDNEEHRDAIAGHINLKHPDQPKVKRAKDFRVEIPRYVQVNMPYKDDGTLTATVSTEEPEYRVRSVPDKTLEEGFEEILDKEEEVEALKPRRYAEVEITPPKELKLSKKELLKAKYEQQLKELENSE